MGTLPIQAHGYPTHPADGYPTHRVFALYRRNQENYTHIVKERVADMEQERRAFFDNEEIRTSLKKLREEDRESDG